MLYLLQNGLFSTEALKGCQVWRSRTNSNYKNICTYVCTSVCVNHLIVVQGRVIAHGAYSGQLQKSIIVSTLNRFVSFQSGRKIHMHTYTNVTHDSKTRKKTFHGSLHLRHSNLMNMYERERHSVV